MSSSDYKMLADLVFASHVVVIVMMLGGGVLAASSFGQEHPGFRRFHVTFVVMVIISQILFLGCPLVELEYTLRHQYDPSIKPGGSFTVYLIRTLVGVTVPVVLVTISTYLIGAIAVVCWLVGRSDSRR